MNGTGVQKSKLVNYLVRGVRGNDRKTTKKRKQDT